MTGPMVQGTFTNGSNPVAGNTSDVIDIPEYNRAFSAPTMKLTTVGCNASNTLKTQKSTNNGSTWADQTTYNSEQTNTPIAVNPGEQWRVVNVAEQAITDLRYKLSMES